jgi:hypothetical protein
MSSFHCGFGGVWKERFPVLRNVVVRPKTPVIYEY